MIATFYKNELWEEIRVTEQNKGSLVWVSFYTRELTEKEQIIQSYQDKALEIQNTQSELNIAIEGMDDEDEYIVQMSIARKWVLEARIHTLKQELKAIAQEWVEKFGNEIIWEL